jgi:glycine hydroxymethyltransferase
VFTGDFDPVAHAHVVTTTTHKTLRGPRGGLVLCRKEFAETVDRGCPLVLGGPLAHVMTAKGVALTEAAEPPFRTYAANIVANARALGEALVRKGCRILTGGTDNHLVLLDVRPYGLTGFQASDALRAAHVTTNKNVIPADPNGSWNTSGVRLGTPAMTTLGMGAAEMQEIAAIIDSVLKASKPDAIATGPNAGKPSKTKVVVDAKTREAASGRVAELLGKYPLYPDIDL